MEAQPSSAGTAQEPSAARPAAPYALLLPLLVLVVGVVLLGDGGYTPVHLSSPGLPTALTSAVLQLAAYLSSAYALGVWLTVAFLRVRRGGNRLAVGRDQELQPALWASLQWGVTAVALVFVDSADASGQGLDTLGRDGAVGYLAQAAYLPRAWMVVAVLAFVSAAMALLAAKWEIVAFALPTVLVGVLAPALVTQVLVGPNHDFGGDAAMFASRRWPA
ncbi:hypothetical protein HJ588_16665 [Flexivirga sp. ID2601S]|uniref:Uncharacterized protein n=1 Tax=Flexivirga aerilata TaxID=1656889 RepID=A0A849AW46_9MICO|nr:hypothetical protein [Flexivirga aerilata]NNG40892.1 hypothetical protein [Flexivirga aerilata]